MLGEHIYKFCKPKVIYIKKNATPCPKLLFSEKLMGQYHKFFITHRKEKIHRIVKDTKTYPCLYLDSTPCDENRFELHYMNFLVRKSELLSDSYQNINTEMSHRHILQSFNNF